MPLRYIDPQELGGAPSESERSAHRQVRLHMLLAVLAMALGVAGVAMVVYASSVSYTHLTLPTNREV